MLLRKPPKTTNESSSFLNSTEKMLQSVMAMSLSNFVKENGLHGFKPRHSKMKVVDRARTEMQKNLKSRKLCTLITIDIRNAFNTVRWNSIMQAPEEIQVPAYLLRLIASCLSERYIIVDCIIVEDEGGVPQGLVLVPILWRLSVRFPIGFRLVGYVDDLALVRNAEDSWELQARANQALVDVIEWLEATSMKVAAGKTEAITLIGRKNHNAFTF